MAPPAVMHCSSQDCEFSTPENIPTYELVIRALEIHVASAHSNTRTSASSDGPSRVEKPKRPVIECGMSETDWTFFVHKWQRYTRQTKLNTQQKVDELWACMDSELERLAFSDGLDSANSETLLEKIKTLAVTTIHPSLHIVSLHKMQQTSEESTKAFSARVKATANNCNLKKRCTREGCDETVSFLEETCYHVIMTGLNDDEMKEKVLTQAMLGVVKDLPTLINYTTAEESAKAKNSTREVAGIQKLRKNHPEKKCYYCGQPAHGPNNKFRVRQCKAYGKNCSKCEKKNHFASVCKSANSTAGIAPRAEVNPSDCESDDTPAVSGFITAIYGKEAISSPSQAIPVVSQLKSVTRAPVTTLPVPHYVYDQLKRKWDKRHPKPSPTLTVTVALDRAAYGELKLNLPQLIKKPGAGHARARTATADSGAQLTVINVMELRALGIKVSSIFPLATLVNTVTKTSVDLLGGVFLTFTSSDPTSSIVKKTRQLCYVSKSVPGIYLSEEACTALGCLPSEFPKVGTCGQIESTPTILPKKCQNSGVVDGDDKCACPPRQLPPTDEPVLPCDPTVENLPLIKDYILKRYASSAFNCCEQQPLPLMDTAPPLRLLVDNQATPTAVYTPSPIPHHWQERVKAGLDRDVRLGVLEKVPVNEAVRWCSRMVITAKHDGTPRRVIDFGPLNKNAPRQTHHTKSPYSIASAIPGNTVKTVLDNWHGYHSIPIHPEDRPLTTFLTPYGRYRYRTTPQGFISAGDGYTQRMDLIVEGTPNYEHCVDDSILWDTDIASNFVRVCRFIEMCSAAGCKFNPSKFQFAQEEVDFLGFRVTSTGIKPHPQFLETIRSFPTPTSITDVRSWFGLIGQVSYTFASAPIMEPFRSLLSNKIPFHWSTELESAFNASKEEIIRQCEKGVRNFTPNAPTALATDWSKAAVGCWLTQKFCQ